MPAIPPQSAIATRIMNHQEEVYNTPKHDPQTAGGHQPIALSLSGMDGDYGIEDSTLSHNQRVANALESQCKGHCHHRKTHHKHNDDQLFEAHACGAADVNSRQRTTHFHENSSEGHELTTENKSGTHVVAVQPTPALEEPPKNPSFAQRVADTLKFTPSPVYPM
eukprot:GDKJ01026323.1.p1 GENE.GDKJ01026323.1~~GDKJ01026323.1.p1  ORF type:complete len:165 (+),score=11.70 GDKJ01026323.1:73-567(+)